MKKPLPPTTYEKIKEFVTSGGAWFWLHKEELSLFGAMVVFGFSTYFSIHSNTLTREALDKTQIQIQQMNESLIISQEQLKVAQEANNNTVKYAKVQTLVAISQIFENDENNQFFLKHIHDRDLEGLRPIWDVKRFISSYVPIYWLSQTPGIEKRDMDMFFEGYVRMACTNSSGKYFREIARLQQIDSFGKLCAWYKF